MSKTISVSEDVYNRLKAEGAFGETFNDVIERLLKEIAEYRQRSARIEHRLMEK